MGRGETGRHALREAPLQLVPDPSDEGEQFGLRVNWQSEAVKIEAAEFLVATRVQHDARIRAAHDLELLRHPEEQ